MIAVQTIRMLFASVDSCTTSVSSTHRPIQYVPSAVFAGISTGIAATELALMAGADRVEGGHAVKQRDRDL